MTTLKFDIAWHEQAPEGWAFGPEQDTWADLVIYIDDVICTRNHPAERKGPDKDFVRGALSGIAEWLIECWDRILWEYHSPFQKAPIIGVQPRIPSARDASVLWRDFPSVDIKRAANWQHAHTLGHASTNLALPSMVFVPEPGRIGIAFDHLPPGLDPSIRFDLPDELRHEPIWIARDTFVSSLGSFIESVTQRAGSRSNREWSEWLTSAWNGVQARASHPDHRRRMAMGDFVASRWAQVVAAVPQEEPGLESIFIDAELINDLGEFESIVRMATTEPSSSLGFGAAQRSIRSNTVLVGRPYEQGYELASQCRSFIGNKSNPLELELVAQRLGVELCWASCGAFATAAMKLTRGQARVAISERWHAQRGVAPTRFAIAASLGRLLAEAEAGSYGAAHSSQSRWIETQRANAFAAELLLPQSALSRTSDVEALAESYGISKTAALWQQRNRGIDRTMA